MATRTLANHSLSTHEYGRCEPRQVCLEMESPRPVPRTSRERATSTEKRSKMARLVGAGKLPMQVSESEVPSSAVCGRADDNLATAGRCMHGVIEEFCKTSGRAEAAAVAASPQGRVQIHGDGRFFAEAGPLA